MLRFKAGDKVFLKSLEDINTISPDDIQFNTSLARRMPDLFGHPHTVELSPQEDLSDYPYRIGYSPFKEEELETIGTAWFL